MHTPWASNSIPKYTLNKTTDISKKMYIEPLILMSKTVKKSSTEVYKFCLTHITKYVETIKMNEFFLQTSTWMNLTDIMLNKKSQTQRMHNAWFCLYDSLKQAESKRTMVSWWGRGWLGRYIRELCREMNMFYTMIGLLHGCNSNSLFLHLTVNEFYLKKKFIE